MVHNFVVHKFVYQGFFVYICTLQPFNKAIMNRAFVYGMSVEGENFTDRVKETKRLKLDFENGLQSLLAQCSGLFEQHIHGLTSYQMNFIRAICDGCTHRLWE